MRYTIEKKIPQEFVPVLVYNTNSLFNGTRFFLQKISGTNMWISCENSNIIIPIEDTDEWESLSWLSDSSFLPSNKTLIILEDIRST